MVFLYNGYEQNKNNIMGDILKAYNEWQKQDIERLKNIRKKYESEDKNIERGFLIGIVIFLIVMFSCF